MSLKNEMSCGYRSCLEFATPCPECGRINGKYTGLEIGKLEAEIRYLERILGALKRNMAIQGITVAFKTHCGTDVITSVGTPPHLVMADDETWEEFQR
jgi:hypothetical protein